MSIQQRDDPGPSSAWFSSAMLPHRLNQMTTGHADKQHNVHTHSAQECHREDDEHQIIRSNPVVSCAVEEHEAEELPGFAIHWASSIACFSFAALSHHDTKR